jgi:fumarate reductase subunit D
VSRRGFEPFLWLLFSAGGVAAALMLPVLVLVLGLLVPLGLAEPPDLRALPGAVCVGLIVVVFLCLSHAAHRIRFTTEELLGLSRWDRPIAVLCYGLALAGTVVAAVIMRSM